jgi:Uma2 family endonuclease
VAVQGQFELEELHRCSLETYHRMVEAGVLDEDERVELINGLIVTMSPKSREHEAAIRWLARWLIRNLDDDRFEVGIGNPLTLVESVSEPEPDFVVFDRATPRPYHPATAALVIEVSVSSLRRDLAVKVPLYAAAGVLEYLVLDVDGGRLLVHTEPGAEGYAQRRVHTAGARVRPSAVPLPALDLDELLRAARAG